MSFVNNPAWSPNGESLEKLDCFVNVLIAVKDDYRCKRLVRANTKVEWYVGKKRRFDDGACAPAATEDRCASGLRFLDERHRAVRRVFVDETAYNRIPIQRVSCRERSDSRDQPLSQRVIDGRMGKDTLNRDASLTGAQEPAERTSLSDVVEIGILVDDHSTVAPEARALHERLPQPS